MLNHRVKKWFPCWSGVRGLSGGWVSADVSQASLFILPVLRPMGLSPHCVSWKPRHNAQRLAALMAFYGMIVPAADKTAGPPDSSVLSLSRRGLLAGLPYLQISTPHRSLGSRLCGLCVTQFEFTSIALWTVAIGKVMVALPCSRTASCLLRKPKGTRLSLRALDWFLSWSD
jgi:hypothetical protein